MYKTPLLYSIILLFSINAAHEKGCKAPQQAAATTETRTPLRTELDSSFKAYWFQGKAELTLYEVEQERYGEIRPAQQVSIFVTEDFSRQKQVKLDHPEQAGTDRQPVLKWNAIRRFHTGIYDYSLMQSVFTPLDGSPTLKSTTTVQDWCGQVFTQINRVKDQYSVRNFSYFESEGDTDTSIAADMLEEELWTRLRIDPNSITPGEYRLIPSTLYARMRHQPLKAQKAQISLLLSAKETQEARLQIEYASISRRVTIHFETTPPYRILGWEETDNGALLSRGKWTSARQLPYWSLQKQEHLPYRDSLQLNF